jgi:hypothetical protein
MTLSRVIAPATLVLLTACVRETPLTTAPKQKIIQLQPDATAQCQIRTEPRTTRLGKREQIQWRIADGCKGIGTFKEVEIRFDKGMPNPFTADCSLRGTSLIGPCRFRPDLPGAGTVRYPYSVHLGSITEDPDLEIVF